jgi:hypothetical protein
VGIPGIGIFKKWDLIEDTTGSGSDSLQVQSTNSFTSFINVINLIALGQLKLFLKSKGFKLLVLASINMLN